MKKHRLSIFSNTLDLYLALGSNYVYSRKTSLKFRDIEDMVYVINKNTPGFKLSEIRFLLSKKLKEYRSMDYEN